MRPASQLLFACAAACCAAWVPAAWASPPFPTPWSQLDRNLVDSFGWPNLVVHDGAVALTGVMAFSGADHEVRLAFQKSHPFGDTFAKSAYWGGYIAPSVLAAGLYVVGGATKNRQLAGAGSAAVQALAITALDTAFLKWATGRPFPSHGMDPADPARLQAGFATEFGQESFTTRGYLAWPSGHTSTAVSVAAALSSYYPEHFWVPLVGYPIALLIGIGMIEGDHHWASDVVAGAMIGHVIGYTVGHNMRAYRDGHGTGARWPRVGSVPGARGLSLGCDF